MSRRTDAGSDRLVHASALALLAVVLLAIGRGMTKPLTDPDTYWHLAIGRWLPTTWQFVGPEPWTRFADNPQVLHEWPLELLYYSTWRAFGSTGLVVLGAVGPIVLLATLYVYGRRSTSAVAATLLSLLAWLGASASLALRPQVASVVLLVVVTSAWLDAVRDGRARWFLVPLTWVWANLHGMWVIGLLTGVAAVAGLVLTAPRDRSVWGRHALVVALSVLAATATPAGPALLFRPAAMTGYATFVTEWVRPTLGSLTVVCTLALLALPPLLALTSRTRPHPSAVLLWLLALAWTLTYARTVAVGAAIALPLAALSVGRWSHPPALRSRRPDRAVVVVACTAAVGVSLASAAGAVAEPVPYPDRLRPALAALPSDAAVFDDYFLGGWLLWTQPRLDPYIDGRADVYGVEQFHDYDQVMTAAPGWETTWDEAAVDAALVQRHAPLVRQLTAHRGWRVVGADAGYVLLVPPSR